MSDNYDDLDETSANNLFPLQINLDRISREKTFFTMTRILAIDLMNNPYLSIGSFIKGLSDKDIAEFMDTIESNHDLAMENMLLITELLAGAEGLPSEDLSQLTERCNTMASYLTIESLARKGLVKVHYENMSFGEEFDKKIIVERISDV